MKAVIVYRDSGTVDQSYIDAFEKKLGYIFPQKYKSLLSKHNALRPHENLCNFKLNDKCDSRDVNFFGYGDSVEEYEDIEKFQQEPEYCYRHIVVIGESANGDYICFDYREDPTTDNPPVVVMLHDYPDENNKMHVCPVTDDFEQFMDSLYSDDAEE